MAKFTGKIGFATSVETAPGVWDDQIVERRYRGDILRNSRRWQMGEKINDNFEINNQISLIADTYLFSHLPAIKYIRWMGTNWKVSTAEIERPRVTLTLGDVYNAQTN